MRVCWDPKLDHQTERGKVSFGQTVQHKGMICTIVIVLYFHQVFNPVQYWVGGIYTPNLITVFQECPSDYYEGQEITSGVFGNFTRWDSPNWTLLLESYAVWRLATFGGLRDVPPLSFVTSMSPAESRKFRTSPSGV